MLNYQERLSGVFQALADPTRRAIVEQLSAGPKPVSTLAEPLNLTLAAVLQHVQTLQACGVISTEKQGRVRSCQIEPMAFTILDSWLQDRRNNWQQQFDRLAALLDAQDQQENSKG